MGIEIGDLVAYDGRAGEVVDFSDGCAVVRPFPMPGMEALRPPACFVVHGEARIITKNFERMTSAEREADRHFAEAKARMERQAVDAGQVVSLARRSAVANLDAPAVAHRAADCGHAGNHHGPSRRFRHRSRIYKL